MREVVVPRPREVPVPLVVREEVAELDAALDVEGQGGFAAGAAAIVHAEPGIESRH